MNKPPFRLETDLQSLRTLLAVVDEHGFSAAAKRVHRTQSAVSLQISKLEGRLNTKLLNRSTRSLSLTNAGETFVGYARRIIALADEAALAVAAPPDTMKLRVGFAEYLVPQHLHLLLARFRRANPNCDLSLALGAGSELVEALGSGDLNLVFAGPEGEGGVLLWEERLVWTGTLREDGGIEEPIDLVLMHPPCSYRKIAFDALTHGDRSWKMAIDANSVQAVQSAIRAGLGISILPYSAVLEGMPLIHKALPELPNTSVMSYSPPDHSHPYAERFTNFLCSCINAEFETNAKVIFPHKDEPTRS